MGLGTRVLVILCGVAALSTGLALGLQDRVLSGDLRGAATHRAERASESIRLLVDDHVANLSERFRAVSRTPALRATLEVRDGPTLRFYADTLRELEGAALIVFLDRNDSVMALAGDVRLAPLAAATDEKGLVDQDGFAYAVVSIPLETAGEPVGRLVAAEQITADVLNRWSQLAGAEVAFTADSSPPPDTLARRVRELTNLNLQVAVSVQDEQAALTNSRRNLLAAGGVAMALAFAVSIAVARSLVQPIREIQNAALGIGRGDFDARIDARRSDEIGDVARAVDDMGERLGAYRTQVETQTQQLEENIQELRHSQYDLANAQRLAQMGSWYVDYESGELFGSDEFHAIFGLGADDKPIDPEEVLSFVHGDDRADLSAGISACLDGASMLRVDCRIISEGEPERVLHVHAQAKSASDDRGRRLEGTVQDVTERRRSEEQIRYLNHHDSLTGLGNRRFCNERLEIQLKQAQRSETTLGILNLDIDRFKRINDTLGASLGDALLKGVADRLVAALRSTDYIGRQEAESAISRLGGDEFIIVLPKTHDAQDLAIVARRILDTLARPFDLGGHEVVVGTSIGITAYPNDGASAEILLQNAAAAMNHAKDQGGQNYQFYAGSMNDEALRRLMLESDLRHALDREEFELHYQPKICLTSGRITGAEALVRWRNAEGQLIPPALFIPIAEETGLIGRLGEWVTRTACRQIAEWAREGHSLPVSVNLSIHQFRGLRIANEVRTIVRETGISPTLLELEITESTLMHDEQAVVTELESLREEGIRVSVDDFGTGYSSFAYLRQLPVDAIKIDRSFVMNITEDDADAALAASIVSMGRALGLKVIAEGVETEGQRDLLTQFGADEMQGFLVSPAVPADAFRRLLENGGLGDNDQDDGVPS